MIPKNQNEDVKTLQQQIQKIFSCVVLGQRLSQKGVQKARQLMMKNIKQVVGEALDRSIYRDGTSTQLEAKDILSVISTKGEAYKYKIARSFVMNKSNNQVKQNPQKNVRNVKHEEFNTKGIDEQEG